LVRTEFGSAILRGETRVTFEPENGGTRLTQEFATQGIIPAIAARIFSIGSDKGSFRGELNTFASFAEQHARSNPPDA
jgi:type II secretory pathway component PulF